MPLTSTGSALIWDDVECVQCSLRWGAVFGLIMVSAELKPVRALFPRKVGQSPDVAPATGFAIGIATRSRDNMPARKTNRIPILSTRCFALFTLHTIFMNYPSLYANQVPILSPAYQRRENRSHILSVAGV